MLRTPEVLGEGEPFVLVEPEHVNELLSFFARHCVKVVNAEGPGILRRLRFPTLTAHDVRNLMVFLAVRQN